MKEVTCPYCGKKVKIIRFGFAWVAVCCDKIIYNEPRLPGDGSKGIVDRNTTATDG